MDNVPGARFSISTSTDNGGLVRAVVLKLPRASETSGGLAEIGFTKPQPQEF